MPLSPPEWHQRYLQQARWTRDLRKYLYQRAGLDNARRVLDVGCGTGALLGELLDGTGVSPIGLDILPGHLAWVAKSRLSFNLVQGDALSLPFTEDSFDLVLCHFLLLWVKDPHQAIVEMRRVTRTGGTVLALAEPDYGGRIDYPADLEMLGDWQRLSLKKQGADPYIGRRLGEIFNRAGLDLIEVGILGGQWQTGPSRSDWELEWRVMVTDFDNLSLPGKKEPGELELAYRILLDRKKEEIERLRDLDWTAWELGERILFVPTFYAWGQVIA